MARADYIGCEVCDGKGLYDGDWSIRDREDIQVSVLCHACTDTHVLKAGIKPAQAPSPQTRALGSEPTP